MGIQGVTREYKGLQGITGGYNGLPNNYVVRYFILLFFITINVAEILNS